MCNLTFISGLKDVLPTVMLMPELSWLSCRPVILPGWGRIGAPGDAGEGKEEPEEAGAKSNVQSCAAGGSSTYAEIVQNYSNYCQTVLYRRHYPGSDALFGDRLNSPQIFLYLEERGLGLELLAPLFTSDVTDMAFLKQKMLSYYPQFKNVIMEAFARYEY